MGSWFEDIFSSSVAIFVGGMRDVPVLVEADVSAGERKVADSFSMLGPAGVGGFAAGAPSSSSLDKSDITSTGLSSSSNVRSMTLVRWFVLAKVPMNEAIRGSSSEMSNVSPLTCGVECRRAKITCSL